MFGVSLYTLFHPFGGGRHRGREGGGKKREKNRKGNRPSDTNPLWETAQTIASGGGGERKGEEREVGHSLGHFGPTGKEGGKKEKKKEKIS